MDIAMGAISPLLPKLGGLLVGEFILEKRVRKGVESLVTELALMHAALRKVAKVPPEQLDEGVKIWAGKVKQLAYQMEDIVDAFMVRVEDGGEPANLKNIVKKTIQLFKKGKDLHGISDALAEVVGQAKELAELRQRYEQKMPDTGSSAGIDPRVMALYTDETELVGTLKTVSIVGFGGLGKTTLAKVVYDKIKVQFDCAAFVLVSQNPDMKKVFKDILYELDKNKYADVHNATRDERQLIDALCDFLTNRRYLIVIDDIWDEKAWHIIKCAFSRKSPGSRLITTSRIISVSEACCSSSDHIYKIKPLSHDVSRRLFHKRVFSHGKECHAELVQVSEDILHKCGGIPLAIITIASLLASNHQIKGKDQWYTLLKSIGHGLTEDRSVEQMKKILLFSYYDLPSYLKPCLLYLSIFPEDHKIMRGKLVWKWIAEGLVYSEKQETNLYELGDSYFNELVNRSMIQPIGIDNEEKVEACCVHDMVLDLICSLASEENFATILDGDERKMPNSQNKVWRLSVQCSKVDMATISMSHVRSLTVFSDGVVDQLQEKSSSQVMRVLDLEYCPVLHSACMGNLLQLRYLGLNHGGFKDLPVEIGKLKLLQTLDIKGTSIKNLPSSVVQLRRLMCLHVGMHMNLPYGICNLTSLEVLCGVKVGKISSCNSNCHLAKELGHLTKLRVLRFQWGQLDESLCEALVESLNNLHNLEILDSSVALNCKPHVDLMSGGWVPPLKLRSLCFDVAHCSFLTLPAWINPSSLHAISRLIISLEKVRSEDVQIVGMLPALRYLHIWGGRGGTKVLGVDVVEMFVVSPDSFQCATDCYFNRFTVAPSMFPRGAAPKLKRLQFTFSARWIARGDFDLGMGHLPSLEYVSASVYKDGATDTEVKEAKAALVAAANTHPNRPILHMYKPEAWKKIYKALHL